MVDESDVNREQEELRQRMEQSRDALAQKIEQLEEKVTETVESATASVAEATATVMETVQNATASVSETVDSVTDAVQGTVETVRQSVEGTVDSVKSAFDLSERVREHPWLMLAGAVTAGYVTGRLLEVGSNRHSSLPLAQAASQGDSKYASGLGAEWERQPFVSAEMPSNDRFRSNGVSSNGNHSTGSPSEAVTQPAGPSWTQQLVEALRPEMAKLERFAIGALLGAARDLVKEAVPPAFRQPLAEVIDGFTENIGGKRMQESMFSSSNQKPAGY